MTKSSLRSRTEATPDQVVSVEPSSLSGGAESQTEDLSSSTAEQHSEAPCPNPQDDSKGQKATRKSERGCDTKGGKDGKRDKADNKNKSAKGEACSTIRFPDRAFLHLNSPG